MEAGKKQGGGHRAWLVVGVAAVAGVIAGVGLSRSGGPPIVPTFGAAAADLASPPPPHRHRRAPAAEAIPTGPRAPAAALEGLPSYPGARPRGIGQGIEAAGIPMTVAYFTTPDPPEDVMSFYQNALEETHAHVVHEWMTRSTGYVGWRDKRTDELHGVVIARQGNETMVLPSTAAPGRYDKSRIKPPEVLPMPSHAEGTLTVSMGAQENGSHQDSVVTTVPLTTVRAMVDFYKKAYAEKGWTVGSVNMNSDTAARVVATRPDMRAETYLQHVTGGGRGPRVRVYVILTTRAHA